MKTIFARIGMEIELNDEEYDNLCELMRKEHRGDMSHKEKNELRGYIVNLFNERGYPNGDNYIPNGGILQCDCESNNIPNCNGYDF